MEIKYDDYSFSDEPKQRFIPYQPEEHVPYYGPDEERFKFERNPEYYFIRDVKKKPRKKTKPKPKPKPSDTSDLPQAKAGNEKLYIGLLLGSTGLFLATLFYFLFIQNKKKK